MTDTRQAAIDRLTERLVGVWAKAMLQAHGDNDRFGFYLRHAMTQTETLAAKFCDFVDPKPAAANGHAAQPTGVRK